MIEQINKIAEIWWNWMCPMFWQVSVLIPLIGLIDIVIRKRVWPQIRYALWLLVLVKLILPPTFALSTSLTSQLQPLVKNILARQEGINKSMAIPKMEETETGPETSIEPIVISPQTGWPDNALITSSEAAGLNMTRLAAPERPSWHVYLMLVWLAGALVLTTWLKMKFRQLRNPQRGTTGKLPPWFGKLLTDTARRVHLRKTPKVVLSENVVTPAVFGVFRPVLLLPKDGLNGFSRKDTEHILLHELAHMKRGDLWVHCIYMVLQVVYWFNPLLWLVRRRLQHLRELCCDATVGKILRDRTCDYRQTIMDTAERFLAKSVELGIGLVSLFEDYNSLIVRLRWLEMKPWKYRGLRAVAVVAILGFMSICILPMATAEESSSENQSVGGVNDTKPATSLHQAAAEGDIERVEQLMSEGADLNNKDTMGRTPLHLATRYARGNIAKLLIAEGANVDATNEDGWTPLHFATHFAALGSQDVVEVLIASGADINAKDKLGRTPLHHAVITGYVKVIGLLIKEGADLNSKDKEGATLLHYAASYSAESSVKYLLAKGIDINARDQQGRTALHMVTTRNMKQFKNIVELLLSNGINISVEDHYGRTPLHEAAERGRLALAELLITKGADVNEKDKNGRTPLHTAAKKSHNQMIEFLLSRGANINAKDNVGLTPLHYAARAQLYWMTGRRGSKSTVELLITKEADVDARAINEDTAASLALDVHNLELVDLLITKGGDIPAMYPIYIAAFKGDLTKVKSLMAEGIGVDETGVPKPLIWHAAAYGGHKESVEFLIAKGVDVNTRNKRGTTALHLAAYGGHKDVIQLLIDNGAEINARRGPYQTPLHMAALFGHESVAEVLIAKGADVNAGSGRWTPLQSALGLDRRAVVRLLLTKGADANAGKTGGWTPLHVACKYAGIEMVELLIANGANVNAEETGGWTPLYYAIWHHRVPVAELLLDNGANPNVRDMWAFTPLQYVAKEGGPRDMVELLVAKGADVNLKQPDGRTTALEIAKEANHMDLIAVLRKHGAKE